jgi:hypothetical protein
MRSPCGVTAISLKPATSGTLKEGVPDYQGRTEAIALEISLKLGQFIHNISPL